jgi:hypothetical protein
MTLSDDLLQSLDLGGEENDIRLFLDAVLNLRSTFQLCNVFIFFTLQMNGRVPEFTPTCPAQIVSFAIRDPHSSSVIRLSALDFADIWSIPNILGDDQIEAD